MLRREAIRSVHYRERKGGGDRGRRDMASKDITASCFVSVSRDITESIRKIVDKSSIKFIRGIKLDTKNGKSEDRILVLTTWRLYFLTAKVPTKIEVTFNFLEIRAMNSHPEFQVVIDLDKSTYSLRLQSRDHLSHVVSHVNFALSRIFNNSVFSPSICHSDSDLSEGSRKEFNLVDFSHLESRDLAVIVASMAYNTWFTKLYCKDLRIGSEVSEQVLHTLSKSSSLAELTLENAGLKSDFAQKLSVALSENPASVIHSLNLAHNTLDNQGVSNLIQQVCRLSKGLRLLNLSKTSLNSRAECISHGFPLTLCVSQNLYLFLSQPNCLVHLDLSDTDCAVDSLFGALLRGCCADLSYLNLSKNSFSHRKVKETLPLFRQFFSSAFSLTHVSLASMKLPPDALRSLFIGLTTNPHINDLHLDISGCELKSAGAAVIQELFPRHLYLGKNFNIKSRVLEEILQKLVQLIQEEECALQSLSLADSRLRSRGTVLVNALGSNTCLRKVDLSGNSLEDIGAKMLSKALQINTTLRQETESGKERDRGYCQVWSVTWDRNNTSATGFLDVARALEHNFTLQYMPLPLSDISQAFRSSAERTEQALTKVMERLCVRVQQQVCVLRGVGEMEEIQAAKQVLKEARNSRALYPSLCELAHVLSVDGPVRQKLDSLAGELAKAADKELQVIVDSMVSLCRELCPLSSSAAERLSPPLSSVSERTRQVSQVKRWEGTCDGGTGRRSHRHRDSLDITDEELGTSIDTIAIKKHSSRTRRIRPVSTRLSLCDDSSSSPPASASSSFSALSRSASCEGLSELPTQGAPLHHVTRVRPRPPRRHRAGHAPSDTHCTENGTVTPLDDGLPDFYSKRLSSLHKAHSLRRKKRRNMLAIFGFRRNRNSTLSNQGPESGRDGCGEECHTVATAPTGTATENVYTLLQPPRSAARACSPGEGADGKVEDQRREEPVGLSLQPVQSIPPQPGMPGSRHPFYSPSQPSELETEHEQPAETDRHWSEDRQWTEGLHTDRERTLIRPADRQADRHWTEDKLSDKTWTEGRTAERQMDRYWTEGRNADRHMERQWTVDRHTQRQIDRQFDRDRQWTVSKQQTDRQWTEGRPTDIQIDRQWIERRPTDIQIDRQWIERRPTDIQIDRQWKESRQSGRQSDRQAQGQHLAQRPLPPYPSDRTPSPKIETDSQKNMEATIDRQKHSDTQTERHLRSDTAVGQVEGWRGGGGVPPGRVSMSADEEADGDRDGGRMERKERDRGRDAEGQPPPIPEKPKTSYMSSPNEYANERLIHPPAPYAFSKPVLGLADRAFSQGEEEVRPQAPVKPQRNRKAMSCDTGTPVSLYASVCLSVCLSVCTDMDGPNNLEKHPNHKPPVNKPRLLQNRNKSMKYSVNSASGNSELL
ncbi:unnamed protein product [Coregonus sp. 'balchen']|nr:unnamed protein product [Coregonus sp. 'balchen']